MRGVFGRAVVAAGAAGVVLGLPAGAAAARTGPPVLAFRPAPYDYGQVSVGQRAARTFTLANTGGRASSALTVTVSGPAAFTITADMCKTSLAPGKTCTVRVRFAPARAGAAAATLRAVSKNRAATARDALAGTGQGLGSAGHIYWANIGFKLGTINEAGLPGGGTATTLVSGQNGPVGVAVDGSHIYWANGASGTIDEAPLGGGTITTLVSGQNAPQGVAVDSSHIYWANAGSGTIDEAPLGGGTITTLVRGQNGPEGVAVDSNHIYWANAGDGTIDEAPLTGGGTVTTLVTGQNTPRGVAVNSSHIYWANEGDGTIDEAPLTGGTVTTLVRGPIGPFGVAVDSNHIYWASAGTSAIDEAPLGGGGATTLVDGQEIPTGVAVGP